MNETAAIIIDSREADAHLITHGSRWFAREIAEDVATPVKSRPFRSHIRFSVHAKTIFPPSSLSETEADNLSAGRSRAEMDKKS